MALTPRLLRGADGEAHVHDAPKSLLENAMELDVFASVLDWLWTNGYQPIFVPMNTVSPDDDGIATRRVMERAKFGGKALLIDEEILPRDAELVYSHCQAGFVSRVHGSIIAFLDGCPVMMYAFDRKHKGIMEQIRSPEHIFDPGMNTSEDAVRMISRCWSNALNCHWG